MEVANHHAPLKTRKCREQMVRCMTSEIRELIRAGATSPVGQVSTGPLFSPSALTADLGDYDVRGSINE